MLIAAAAVLGLIFGSFATVAAHRIPRRRSIVTGRSECPNCGRTIRAVENIPVLSWLILRGRCPGCEQPISPRYPLIELGMALLFASAAERFGYSLELLAYAAFFWVLVVLTVIDLEHRLLPNRVVLPAFVGGWIVLAAIALVDGEPSRLFGALVGALIFGGFFFVVALIVPAGMGGGDVKLAFVLGTFLGYLDAPGLVLAGMFFAFFAGGVIGIVILMAKGGDRKTAVPFGPFLALGTIVAVLVGEPIVDAYLGNF
ncbi:MAG: prepilin peptidase [Actinomycetota bacterium]